VTITRLEVEVNGLKNAADHVMDMVEPQVAGEEAKLAIDRLLAVPQKLVDLLRAKSLTVATESLVRLKSHYLEVNMVKVREGPDGIKDLKDVEEEIRVAAEKIMDAINYVGDDGEE
jgi:hypothetical protein